MMSIDGLDCEDDTFHLHNAHAHVFVNGGTVGALGFPVVAVDGYAAITAGLDHLADATFLTNQGFGVTETFALRFVQFLDERRPHKQQTQCRNHCKQYNLPCKRQATAGQNCGYSGTDGKTQDEKITG